MRKVLCLCLLMLMLLSGCKSTDNQLSAEPEEQTAVEADDGHDAVLYYEDFLETESARYDEVQAFADTMPTENFLKVETWAGERTKLEKPNGIAVVGDTLWVADEANHEVRVFDLKGNAVKTLGGLGNGPGEFQTPRDVWYASFNDSVYVLDAGNGRVQRFDSDGSYLDETSIVLKDDGHIYAQEMAVDNEGRIYVAVEHGIGIGNQPLSFYGRHERVRCALKLFLRRLYTGGRSAVRI